MMYTYSAQLEKVVDGDTLDLVVDLGFKIYHYVRVRLAGINTPERDTVGGLHAKAFVEGWFSSRGELYTIKTEKDKIEKYGRYLAYVFDCDGHSLSSDLITAGLGVYWNGVGKKPIPEIKA